ncbi:MAG TPA: hypothetical protein VMT96_00015, partial [Candidatus Bathyarchaeia archaeon]|nr:hypothetical protein [Candidatus Bathyarchaeia archaeon]
HSRGLLNFSNYSSPTSDDLLSSARTSSDKALRDIKYNTFAKQWLQDVPAIGLYRSDMIYINSKATEAVQPDEAVVSADDHYANVLNWTALKAARYKTP